MNKKLSAKIQRINPAVPDTANSFSDTLTIIPDDKDVVIKKGVIYCVFNVSGTLQFDTKLLTKIVTDILHDSYYQSDNISPIQSMEKAISDVRDGVTKISIDTAKAHEAKVEFNITSAVLWGNVVYLVQYGKGNTYLIRDNSIKTINVITEGSFSSASGVIKDGDVVVLCTDEFSRIYTPEKLLVTSISEKELPPSAGCLILKFIVDTTFSENEMIQFADTSAAAAPKKHKKISLIKLKNINKPTIKLSSKYVIPILLAAFIFSIFLTLKSKQKPATQNITPITSETTQSTQSAAATPPVDIEKLKLVRTSAVPFYDIKITDANANPSEIAVLDNNVVVADKATGKVYISAINTPKFTTDTNVFAGINSLTYDGGKLSFSDTEGYKVYNTATSKTAETYPLANLSMTSTYLGFIYSLTGDKIISGLTEIVKLQNMLKTERSWPTVYGAKMPTLLIQDLCRWP